MKKQPINMTIEELSNFLINNGHFNTTHHIGGEILKSWHTPKITRLSPDVNSNTIFFDYTIERVRDGLIHENVAQLDFNDCSVWHNNNYTNRCHSSDFKLKDYNYLIKHGYDLPLLDYKND